MNPINYAFLTRCNTSYFLHKILHGPILDSFSNIHPLKWRFSLSASLKQQAAKRPVSSWCAVMWNGRVSASTCFINSNILQHAKHCWAAWWTLGRCTWHMAALNYQPGYPAACHFVALCGSRWCGSLRGSIYKPAAARVCSLMDSPIYGENATNVISIVMNHA